VCPEDGQAQLLLSCKVLLHQLLHLSVGGLQQQERSPSPALQAAGAAARRVITTHHAVHEKGMRAGAGGQGHPLQCAANVSTGACLNTECST
jgi:hypothetical protein